MAKLFTRSTFRCLIRLQSYGINKPSYEKALRRYSSHVDGMSVVYKEYGDPNKVLTIENFQLSKSLKDDEVMVKMLMAPVNPSDINMIEGTYVLKPPLPAVVGNEGVAEVVMHFRI